MNTTSNSARTVISTDLVQNLRTPNQVKDAVRTLNIKLRKLQSWRGHKITMYDLEAKLEDGVIAIRFTEPDRSLQGLPAKVWAERFLDVNQSAVSLYRWGKVVNQEGMGAAIKSYVDANPFGPTPASSTSWDAK